MANAKISELTPATTPLAGTEVLPIVQGGVTDKVSVANLTAGRTVTVAGITFGDATTQMTAAATTSGTSILYGNGSGGFSNVTIGSNLTFTGGTLSATGGGGSGDVTGPSSSVSGNVATFDGTTGKIIQDGGKALPSGFIVGTSDSQTLTNKTLTNPTITNYIETLYTANTGSAITVDLTNGTIQKLTLNAASVTITMPTAAAGKSFMVILAQDATGGRAVTWTTVVWPSGATPSITTTANKRDIFSFWSDGTSWFGTVVGQNY